MVLNPPHALLEQMAQRLSARGSLRIVMLSDLGFEYGAGAAMRRQIQSLLLDGHEVAVVCAGSLHEGRVVAASDPGVAALVPRGREFSGTWLGVHSVPAAACMDSRQRRRCDPELLAMVAWLQPDLVIAGNLHWAGWSAAVLEALTRRGIATVAYMHDLHHLTGRCAHPYTCRKFLTGCDASCPTAEKYPALSSELIADEWMVRRHVFVETAVPLVANSTWTKASADAAFGNAATVDIVRLGVDTKLFAPIDRSLARHLLGVDEKPTVLFGAVDVGQVEKGGVVLQHVVDILQREGINFVAFGYGSAVYRGVRGLGYVSDERQMPILYAACDCYLSASAVESFGQTVLEASACARPVVTLRGGGIVDIARDGVNGRTIADAEPRLIADVVREIVCDAAARDHFGAAGRLIAEREFSLDAQAASWRAWMSSQGEPRASREQGQSMSEARP